ncbi:putative transposase, partial [Shigella flexneri K-304]
PCFTAMRAEIALMSGSAFAVTHHAFSSGAGRTSDGNGSHASTLKSPSYTKSVSWQHYPVSIGINSGILHNGLNTHSTAPAENYDGAYTTGQTNLFRITSPGDAGELRFFASNQNR